MEISISQYGLEVLKVLAGIANAERVGAGIRDRAETCIAKILDDMKEELIKQSLEQKGVNLNV